MSQTFEIPNADLSAPVLWRPIFHIGVEGDRRGLCGAPTLGIPATRDVGDPCVKCDQLWDQMDNSERRRFNQRKNW